MSTARSRAASRCSKCRGSGRRCIEQCAGFLRIADGDEPLDSSSVHPEAYPVVERIVKSCGREVKQLIGDGNYSARAEAGDVHG